MRKGFLYGMFGCFGVGAAIVIAIIVVAAIANGGRTGTPGLSASASPKTSAAPTPAPTPVVLTGRGSKVVDPLNLSKGNYRVTWTASGNDNFIVTVHGQTDEGLINEIPPNPSSGEAFFQAAGGHYLLEIKAATLSWSITFTPVSS